ncbi:MAG: FtsK/SpoIIIE domain-containing protein [Nocardioidaceae bacterium]
MSGKPPLVRTRPERDGLPLWALALLAILRLLVALAVRCARHPLAVVVLAVMVIGAIYARRLLDPWGPVILALLVVAALVGWRFGHVGSFRKLVAFPFRAARRRVWVYGRWWPAAMQSTGLTKTIGGEERLPKICRVKSTATVDEVTVKILPGQVYTDYTAVADRLATLFEAVDCRVRTHAKKKRKLRLWILVRDPLAAPVDLLEVPDKPNLARVPVAMREDGLVYRLRLLGTHVLIAGATGAGKGSVLWSIIRALGSAIADRSVELWVIDPKGGMELTPGERLFAKFCYGDVKAADSEEKRAYEAVFADFLDDAVQAMQERQSRLRGVSRQHKPSPGDPAIVLVIDELASLTAYVSDRDTKKRIDAALSLLWSQGRAVGVNLVAALQDPRKEVLSARGLIPTRIALRLNEPEEPDMVLGAGARKRGARCDDISAEAPGIGYVAIDGVPEPIRIRFGYVSDAEIATICALYDPARQTTGDLRALPEIGREPVVESGIEPGTEAA